MEIRKALDLLHDRMDSDREQRVSDLDEQAGTPVISERRKSGNEGVLI